MDRFVSRLNARVGFLAKTWDNRKREIAVAKEWIGRLLSGTSDCVKLAKYTKCIYGREIHSARYMLRSYNRPSLVFTSRYMLIHMWFVWMKKYHYTMILSTDSELGTVLHVFMRFFYPSFLGISSEEVESTRVVANYSLLENSRNVLEKSMSNMEPSP